MHRAPRGQWLQDAIQLPLTAADTEHRLSGSIGIAFGDSEPDALLTDADAAA